MERLGISLYPQKASLEKNLDPETKENWKEIVRGL